MSLRALAPAVALVAWTLAAAGAGWLTASGLEQDRCAATIATLKADKADADRESVEQALARLQAAQERADTLEDRLAAAEKSRQTQEQAHAKEIKRLTTGRLCLDTGAVRLLNDAGLPAAVSSDVSAPAGGSAATDGGSSSDTDVALWAAGARRQYDACRARLDALIDWHQ